MQAINSRYAKQVCTKPGKETGTNEKHKHTENTPKILVADCLKTNMLINDALE